VVEDCEEGCGGKGLLVVGRWGGNGERGRTRDHLDEEVGLAVLGCGERIVAAAGTGNGEEGGGGGVEEVV